MIRHNLSRRVALAALLSGIALLGACASTPKTPAPVPVQTSIKVAPNVNPDFKGRASPIVVRIYELKSLSAFNSADFFSVYEHAQETLGGDLVASEAMTLAPGEARSYEKPLQNGTQFIGVVAAYRDLEHSAWRAAVAVPPPPADPKQKTIVHLSLDAVAASLVVEQPQEKKKCTICIF